MGYLSLKPEQVNAFFKLIEQRYGKKSTILTTNLEYEEWHELFQRKNLVDALLDRLRHHCTTVRLSGPSLRDPAETEAAAAAATETPTTKKRRSSPAKP